MQSTRNGLITLPTEDNIRETMGEAMDTNGDAPYVRLVSLLAEYDSLLEQLQSSMSDGFHNLSRANYFNKDSLRGSYGVDYWDESYIGELTVEITGSTRPEVDIIRKKPILKTDDDGDDGSLEEKPDATDSTIKKRKGKNKEEKQRSTQKKKNTVYRDPITMFGGGLMIPSSLRQCQSNFKGCIPLFTQLINCKIRLNELLEEIKD
ncbi:hypothetical protein NCAS_0A01600 [Naumovozyma castellii]|uniref:Vacuolar ATPase assembly protein VMA22 n=1 Tax=Naumovozyma castellii TaxID=27288 RepID=G0V5I2_NAUCA|nr:hypothetical protein NCAS_0A01600 [Naumovozyma castellii CBS 4309]CCC66718.1 hypothetical protein NCAS_0A01600 [Naumovozyma castellii CBS 4309]